MAPTDYNDLERSGSHTESLTHKCICQAFVQSNVMCKTAVCQCLLGSTLHRQVRCSCLYILFQSWSHRKMRRNKMTWKGVQSEVVKGNWTHGSSCSINLNAETTSSSATRPWMATIWFKIWPLRERQEVQEDAEQWKGKSSVSRRKKTVWNDKCAPVGVSGGEELQVVCPDCSFHAWAAARSTAARLQSSELTPRREK